MILFTLTPELDSKLRPCVPQALKGAVDLHDQVFDQRYSEAWGMLNIDSPGNTCTIVSDDQFEYTIPNA